MKKVMIFVVFACVIALAALLSGCGTPVAKDDSRDPKISSETVVGIEALDRIDKNLYYDTVTGIVYFWNGIINNGYSSTTPTPYYAPNGLPYKYNPETNRLYEIVFEEGKGDK